ncbi:MAG: hypothetical protein JO322_00790 [Candidatus Eremiobacteraeota bacterium]|nr:hypothetical protein [Candidatus Eremiobacteraeota bacterium]
MLTKFLARLLGLWIVLVIVGLVLTRQASVATINALFSDAPLMWVTGIFTMLVGLVIVLLHNRWSGGGLPVVVTLYGWIALLKGISLVWLPAPVQGIAWQSLRFDRFFFVYVFVALVIGGYLVYGGFARRPPRRRAA